MEKVIVESPYAWDINKHIKYLKLCMLDCFKRWEAPFASHLLYTPILDDNIEEERNLGIEAWLVWGNGADKTVVYTDFWISRWMEYGIDNAKENNRPIEYRKITFETPKP